MLLRARHAPLWLAALASLAPACKWKGKAGADGGASPPPPPVASSASFPAGPPRLVALEAASDARSGSAVVVAKAATRLVAYVADEDDRAVHAIDLTTKSEIGALELNARPTQMVVTKQGKLAVALRDTNEVALLEATRDAGRPLVRTGKIVTEAEPVALAITPDDATLLVADGWSAKLEGFRLDAPDAPRAFVVGVAREPRAVIALDAGRAMVAHAAESALEVVELGAHPSVRAIDLGGARAAREGWSLATMRGKDGHLRVLAPHTLVDPGAPATSGGHALPTTAFTIDVVDATPDPKAPARAGTLLGSRTAAALLATSPACLLPRAALADDARGVVYVACAGDGSVVEHDARNEKESQPALHAVRRWPVPPFPTAIARDDENAQLVVWSAIGRTLSFLPLDRAPLPDGGAPATTLFETAPPQIAVPRASSPPSDAVAAGEKLFFTSGDRRVAGDGRACASCHPDGRDDGIVWATADGPRQTLTIAGRTGAGPYGWRGTAATMAQYIEQKVKRLEGSGLEAGEIAQLAEYLTAIPAPPAPPTHEPADARVVRGKVVFQSTCASCHSGSELTDHLVHDVGTAARGDVSPELQTPSLRFVSGTPPYLHDGRAATLRDVLGGPAKHGNPRALTESDVGALEAFLRTL